MPIYDYECSLCGNLFEIFQRSMTASEDQVGATCVRCGDSDTRRVVSRVGVLKSVGPGLGRAAYPSSWEQTNSGDPETVSYWQRRVERERSQEASDPGLTLERHSAAERQWDKVSGRGGSSEVGSSPAESVSTGSSDSGHSHNHGSGGHSHAPSDGH